MTGNTINGKPEVNIGEEANSEIQNLINESQTVLDFVAEITDENRDQRAVGMAVGIDEGKDGEPHRLVLSFAVEHVGEDKVIVGEEKRVTVLLPIGHAFTFGNGVVAVCDALHDYIETQREKRTVESLIDSLHNNNLIDSLRDNQKSE